MADNRRVKKSVGTAAREIRGVTRPDVEAEVREYLGSTRIQSTKEIAEDLKRDRGAVYRACKSLYGDGVLRLSRISKVLYRFALTGEVLHGDNYPVITRLIAKVRTGSRESGSLRENFWKIFTELRNVNELKTPSRLSCIDRCEEAARTIGINKWLMQQMTLRPFQAEMIRWWPQTLEDEYIEPMQSVADMLDKVRIQRFARRFPQLYRTGSTLAGRNPSIEEKDAKKVILQTLKAYVELLEEPVAARVEKLLKERDAQLNRLAAKETILRDDLKVTTETELEKGLVVARSTSLDEEGLGYGLLNRIDQYLFGKLLESLGHVGRSRKGRWGWKSWLVSSAQIAWGGALIGFDLSLAFGGILPGVALSVAGVNIGVALALAGSIHTGGKNVLYALKEMAKELELNKQNREQEKEIAGKGAAAMVSGGRR